VDVIVFYLNIGQTGHFAFTDAPAHLTYQTYGNSQVSSAKTNYGTQYSYTQGQGATALKFSHDVLIYLLDKETAWNFFAVPTTSNPNVAPSEQILALGPYLVREATVNGNTVSLVGDNANTTSLELVYRALHCSERSSTDEALQGICRVFQGQNDQMERKRNPHQTDNLRQSDWDRPRS
jgi:beta-galactosidase